MKYTNQQTNTKSNPLQGVWEHFGSADSTALPIFQSTAFGYETAESLENVFAGREPGYIYSRIANPTVAAFERRMAILEDGAGAVACSSGMAAITATVMALAQTGDEIISGSSIFGGTYSLFAETLNRYGIHTRFVESTDPDAYRNAINDRTRLIFVETIGNPKLDVPDLEKIGESASEKGVVLVVDNTVTTPLLIQPKFAGANLVIHSTSKYINGHGTAIGGVIIDCGTFDWSSSSRYNHIPADFRRAGKMALLAFLRNRICRDFGCCLSPFNAFLMSIGIESLAVRMERHCDNALQVAEFLAAHPRIREVRYPGLKSHLDHDIARRQFGDRYGAMLTLRLDDKAQCFRFIDRLQTAYNLANLGDTRTLVIHPASTFCRELNDDQRHALGVSDDLVRLSIGIESGQDILSDLEQSLVAV